MTQNQIVFVIALGAITLLIVFFSIYVASSTVWSNRWIGRRRK